MLHWHGFFTGWNISFLFYLLTAGLPGRKLFIHAGSEVYDLYISFIVWSFFWSHEKAKFWLTVHKTSVCDRHSLICGAYSKSWWLNMCCCCFHFFSLGLMKSFNFPRAYFKILFYLIGGKLSLGKMEIFWQKLLSFGWKCKEFTIVCMNLCRFYQSMISS